MEVRKVLFVHSRIVSLHVDSVATKIIKTMTLSLMYSFAGQSNGLDNTTGAGRRVWAH